MGRLRGEAAKAKWRGLLREQEESGTTVAGFCRDRGLCAPHFFWWRRRLREESEPPPAFVELKLGTAPPPSAPELELRLRGGRVLVLRPGVDLSWVSAVAVALEAEP